MVLALAAAVITLVVRETVKRRVSRLRELSIRPRIGVPRALIPAFAAPAVTAFSTFSLLGFYSALRPAYWSKLCTCTATRSAAGSFPSCTRWRPLALVLTRWITAREAMLAGLALLIPALALLALAPRDQSLPERESAALRLDSAIAAACSS